MVRNYLRQASYAVPLQVTVLHARERPKNVCHHILCSTLQQKAHVSRPYQQQLEHGLLKHALKRLVGNGRQIEHKVLINTNWLVQAQRRCLMNQHGPL